MQNRRKQKQAWRQAPLIVVAVAMLQLFCCAATAEDPKPTFNQTVAAILLKHCANCHRQGEIASATPLVSYEDARRSASAIKQAVLSGDMPPWPADSVGSLKFRNDPRLSAHEVKTLMAWVDAGTPKGNGDAPNLPVTRDGWLDPKGLPPDLVLTLPTFHIPAAGEIPYVRYLEKVPLDEDKWVVAIQVRPSNRAVVHHIAITEVALNDGMTPADVDGFTRAARLLGLPNSSFGLRPAVTDPANAQAADMLGVYTPGTTFETYRNDSAKLLRGGKNMYLRFNIHYQSTGKPETDSPEVAFWFQPRPPGNQLYRVPAPGKTLIANGRELLSDAPGETAEGTGLVIPPIPAFADDYELIGITAYTDPVTIYQLQPHAHLRGKDFKYTVVYPDGHEVDVLNVPKYDFHWQLAYDLDDPLTLPAGSKLIVTAHYDNSVNNHGLMHHGGAGAGSTDSSPAKEVYFRQENQSWDEMFSPFIQYAVDAPAAGQDKLNIVEAVGCLKRSGKQWTIENGSELVPSTTQSTSSSELKSAAVDTLGSQRYELVGVRIFDPSSKEHQKVSVKGVLVKDSPTMRLNVTSLQAVATRCP